MDKKRLHTVLEQTLKVAPPPAQSRRMMHMWMHDAHSGSTRGDPQAVALLEALRLEAELRVFDGTMLHVLSVASQSIEYWHLGAWLVSRSINPMSIMPPMVSLYMSMQRDVPYFRYSAGYSA